jgi:thiamine-monophosphate kinase
VVRAYATASMDVSDGLAGDLAKLCRASKVGAQVEVARVPLSKAAQAALANDGKLIEPMLSGGDDYEVLCTVPQRKAAAFQAAARAAKIPVTAIGRIVKGEGANFLRADGKPLRFKRASFSHF